MRKNDADEEYFALVMLDVRTAFFDIHRVLEVAKANHSDLDVMIVSGHKVRERVADAIRQVETDFEGLSVEDGPPSFALSNVVEERKWHLHVLAERLDRYLENHFQQDTLSLGHLSENFHISTSYITRLFREHVGMSFRRRLNTYRVEKAKFLLRNTNQTVDCIAREVGFKNHARLTEAFYRFEGMPPGRYRRNGIT